MNPAVMPTYGRTDVQFVRGEGAWLIDHQGERYLDGLSGLGVVALGHANPAVAQALSEQSQQLLHTSNLTAFLAKNTWQNAWQNFRAWTICSSETPVPKPASARLKLLACLVIKKDFLTQRSLSWTPPFTVEPWPHSRRQAIEKSTPVLSLWYQVS